MFGPDFRLLHFCHKGFTESNAAILPPPTSTANRITTLELDLITEEGKKVCQQVLLDIGRYWKGEPVEYLALYCRYW